jgi:photosystem II stability/assembly factor-like uncharacterized protein
MQRRNNSSVQTTRRTSNAGLSRKFVTSHFASLINFASPRATEATASPNQLTSWGAGGIKARRFNESIEVSERIRSRFMKRSVLVVTSTTTAGLLLASVALAIGSPSTSPRTRNLASSVSAPVPWTNPQNELGAPSISTPGGATEGAGAFDEVTCPTASLCVAAGGDSSLSGIVAISNDDGGTWTASTMPAGLPEVKSVSCSSATHCVAVGSGVAITSSDGGVTWSAHSIPTSNTALLGVSCPSGTTTCVAVGVIPNDGGPLNGAIVTSNDGGVTWSAPSTNFPLTALGGVSCASASFCVAVGAQILVTNDGGQTWTQQFVSGGTGILRTVSCGSPTTCVAIGANPMGATQSREPGFEIQSADGGTSWTAVSLPAGSWLVNALSCPDAGDCVLSGPSSIASGAPAWTSSDGGSTWSATVLPTAVSAVSSISCVSASSCVYVGLSGASSTSGTSAGSSGWSSNPVSTVFSTAAGSSS